MNYEKKYKDALERAKGLLEGMDEGDYLASSEDIENLFPELAESEGERMRKAIIDFLKNIEEENESSLIFGNTTTTDMIAWLEKQGEKKPCITEEPTPKFKAGNKVIFTNGNVGKIVIVGTHGYTFENGDWFTHEFVEKDARLYKD